MRIRIFRLLPCLIALAMGSSVPEPAWSEDLAGVYTQALRSDPQYLEAASRILGAREGVVQARQELLFETDLVAEGLYGWNHRDNPARFGLDGNGDPVRLRTEERSGTGYGYRLGVRQPVFHWDDWLSLSQAKSEESKERANLNAALQDLMLRVASSYFDVLRAEDRLISRRGSREVNQDQLKNATERFESSLITIEDVEDVRSRLDAALSEEIAARIARRNADEALREITGISYEELARLRDEMPLLLPAPPDLNPWLDSATQLNMSVVSARHEEHAAFTGVEVQNAAGYFPTLDLVGANRYEVKQHVNNEDGRRRSQDTTIGLQLDIPLDFIGRTRSQKRGALARVEESRQIRRQEERKAERTVRESFRSVVEGVPHIEAAARAIASAERAQKAMEDAYFLGTRLSVHVINSKNRTLLAIQNYNALRYDYLLNGIQLKLGAGTLTDADLLQINRWLDGAEGQTAPASSTPASTP